MSAPVEGDSSTQTTAATTSTPTPTRAHTSPHSKLVYPPHRQGALRDWL